ncbi:MAG: hypothetical protein BWX80_00375 [Candidatus Hydrogenedentes bacterium ADurb.Bin101]|jgi:hypothetical protein|nr:MAG: hypothetical protein BWX80_00375 [Candidatus Hydrogenedentes bacterium ADurb.Bin101]
MQTVLNNWEMCAFPYRMFKPAVQQLCNRRWRDRKVYTHAYRAMQETDLNHISVCQAPWSDVPALTFDVHHNMLASSKLYHDLHFIMKYPDTATLKKSC